MPTTPFDTYTGQGGLMPYMDPETAHMRVVPMVPAGTGVTYAIAKGTVLGEVTASKKFKAYATAAVDGSGVAMLIAQYDCTVDDAGNVTITTDRVFTEKGLPAYYCGIFKTTDLTGLDADAVTDLKARFISGTLADGIFRF